MIQGDDLDTLRDELVQIVVAELNAYCETRHELDEIVWHIEDDRDNDAVKVEANFNVIFALSTTGLQVPERITSLILTTDIIQGHEIVLLRIFRAIKIKFKNRLLETGSHLTASYDPGTDIQDDPYIIDNPTLNAALQNTSMFITSMHAAKQAIFNQFYGTSPAHYLSQRQPDGIFFVSDIKFGHRAARIDFGWGQVGSHTYLTKRDNIVSLETDIRRLQGMKNMPCIIHTSDQGLDDWVLNTLVRLARSGVIDLTKAL